MTKLRCASLLSVVAVCVIGTLASCAASPGPAPIEESNNEATQPTTTTTAPRKQAKELALGIDPVHSGFNPHLLADDSRFIQTLARLTLPSIFVDGRLNTDLVVTVEELNRSGEVVSVTNAQHPEGQASQSVSATQPTSTSTAAKPANSNDAETDKPAPVKTIRYRLASGAQWSDGTPITVADFEYLWSSMLNTPGTLGPAGYWAITDIRSSGGGKTIEVDFNKDIAAWRTLFDHILPSHVLRGVSFATALSSTIPVSAGKFTMKSYDRNRGLITLNRNDRFWGKEPALVENLNFREIRSTDQGIELIQNGQISFMDVTPTETSKEAYSLVPGTQVRTETDKYGLEIVANSHLPKPLRKELRSIIDPEFITRIAYNRRTDLTLVAKPGGTTMGSGMPLDATTEPTEPTVTDEIGAAGTSETPENTTDPIGLQTLNRPLIIGVDPSDPVVASAAKTLVNSLIRYGVRATMKNADTNELMQTLIPRGQVDAVVAKSGANLADSYACPNIGLLGSNRSGFCQADTQILINEYFTGKKTDEELTEYLAHLETDEALRTVIAIDTRLEVLGTGVTGPDPDLTQWPRGYATVDTWHSKN